MAEIKIGGSFAGYESPSERMIRLINESSRLSAKPAANPSPTPPGTAEAGFKRSMEWFKGSHEGAVQHANAFNVEQARKRRP